LHGGPSGFDQIAFTPVPLDALQPGSDENTPGTLFTAAEISDLQSRFSGGAGALFRAISPDGDQGYPGALLVETLVGLLQPEGKPADGNEYTMGSVVIIYRAKLLVDEKASVLTPVNLTQHWGFNLDASLSKELDGNPDALSVKGYRLTIAADHTVAIDEHGLATGELTPTAGTAHVHENKQIGDKFPEAEGSGLGEGYGASLTQLHYR
jgi:aldose 1-epimerase